LGASKLAVVEISRRQESTDSRNATINQGVEATVMARQQDSKEATATATANSKMILK